MSGFSWQDRVRSSASRAAGTKARRSQAVSRMNIEIMPLTMPLLREASRRRNISPTGYIRRAMLAFLAYDLNLPIGDVIATDSRFSPPESRQVIDDPEGKMGGPWDIEDLR